jgi:hypothetical protein
MNKRFLLILKILTILIEIMHLINIIRLLRFFNHKMKYIGVATVKYMEMHHLKI